MRWVVILLFFRLAQGTINWVDKTPLPQPLAGSGCAVINDTIYVIGGRDTQGNRYNTNYIYDPPSDSWSQRAPMPTPRAHVGAGVVNGKIYVIGGWTGPTASNVVEEYDPVANVWQTKSPMPTPRYTYGMAVYNNKIYVIGGMDMQGNIFNVVEEYDPVNDTWQTRAPMPTPRMGPGCAVLSNRIYLFGGSTAIGGGATTVCESYDPVANTWRNEPSMSERRYALGGCTYGGKIYAIGGFDYWYYHTTVEVFEGSSWSYETPMQHARQSIAVSMIENRIYVIGGWNNGAFSFNEEGTIEISAEERPEGLRVEIGPNPFHNHIRISVSSNDWVGVKVFDACGRLIRILYQGRSPATISWDGRSDSGERLPSGVYLIFIEGGNSSRSLPVSLIR